MGLGPTALAMSKDDNTMHVVIDEPDTNGPLLIPCSWDHRRIDISREELNERFCLHLARNFDG